ncbi:hypothetical protein B0J17DRAFT_585007 [Rhizoctonia solani]|nr:hypothetical protein B0J17DRAFT_585036 [Rhizoctonia solani]KAH7312779.1 hypothetical protein B0J17DRAFT_585007 [Rhizoctonia solani]
MRYLYSPGGQFRNKLPWHNSRALRKDIDKLPHGPDWEVQPFKLTGNSGEEVAELWKRNPLEIIRALLQDKALRKYLQYVPQRHYTNANRASRRRSELWTADWLWNTQELINDVYATIISCIISLDETQLTNFAGNKKAHPVYLTIGNLPKRLRRRISKRTTVLIGYLPVPNLSCETNLDKRRQMRRDLFHQGLASILQPLADACKSGGVEMECSDGGVRRIYPVLASYIADFPEQCKVACTKITHCPLCVCQPKTRGAPGDSAGRDRADTLQTMEEERDGQVARFEWMGLTRINPNPFWADHEYVDIGCFLTPDLLHQMHKGVMKDHLIKWVTTILGKPVMDERYKSIPEFHGMQHFKNGITSVSQWTGRELKEMTKVLLPILADSNPDVVKAARALLDFMYLAHMGSVTDGDLDAMEDALRTFHNHKEVFQALGPISTDKGFDGIPKIHMISHYMHLIRELGTPDGYNTETSERLHIDFAKLGYRASNKVNATKQMALYIQRLEAIEMHATYLAELAEEAEPARERGSGVGTSHPEVETHSEPNRNRPPGAEGADVSTKYYPNPRHVVAKTPTATATISELERNHGAERFLDAMRSFATKQLPADWRVDFNKDTRLNIWSRARLFHSPPPFQPSEGPHTEVIRAQPAKIDQYCHVSRPRRFDTGLILAYPDRTGIHRYRPGRIKVIFELPHTAHPACPEPLVYIELFGSPSTNPTWNLGLFTTTRSLVQRQRAAMIVRLSEIRMACHLAPKYSSQEPNTSLTAASDSLQIFKTFYINIFSSHFCYQLVRYWDQDGAPRRIDNLDDNMDQ